MFFARLVAEMCRTNGVVSPRPVFHVTTARARVFRSGLKFIWLCGMSLFLSGASAQPTTEGVRDHRFDNRYHFCHDLPKTVRADHPAILPVVAAIRAVTQDPREQLMMVNDVTHLLVDYDEDERVYGKIEFHATLDEMIARRRESGWVYLRDDCDGRAIFAAHLLAALGIPWRLEASYWKRHAWITATVAGVTYDLLDLRRDAPERRTWSYRLAGRWLTRPSRTPPFFNWRQAWADRTNSDLQIGLRLGLLETESDSGHLSERFAVDWTQVHPEGKASPLDPRSLTAKYAIFPYGEPLQIAALASNEPPTVETEERGKNRVPLPLNRASVSAADSEIGVGP